MKPLRLIVALLIALVGVSVTAPAQAQNVSATRPESVAEVIRGKGYTVEITKDNDGDPMIKAEGNDSKFVVLFYGCTKGANCATITFYAGFTDSKIGADGINAWNKGQRFGRAYIDGEGDPCIEMDVDLDDGGMSRILFEDNVEFWMSVQSQFSKAVYE